MIAATVWSDKRPREQSHPEVRHAKNPHCSSYLTPIYINTPQSPPPSTAWQPAPMATTPTRVVWGEYQSLMEGRGYGRNEAWKWCATANTFWL